MAPTTKCKGKTKTKKHTTKRKCSIRKSSAKPPYKPQDKENDSPTANGQDSPHQATTDDFHEKNWWKINVEKAVSLIERCMEMYNWGRAETKKILNSYRQFLVLKKEHADWDATVLSPCWPVDQMWAQHSQMEDFDYDMRNLLGHVVNRTPAAGAEEKARQDKTTKEAFKQRFGSYDEELWNDINVITRDQFGVEETFEVNRREPLSAIFEVHAHKKGESVEKFHFAFDGKTIDDEDTPMRLGIENNGKIEASYIDKVAVTIRFLSENKEQGFLIDKTSMISKTFDEFAKEVLDTEPSKLVFLSQEKRVYGYESPAALNLKCRDNVIDAVAMETFRCRKCICCNPYQKDEKDTRKDTVTPEDSSDEASVAY
mmetsp:Transcript_13755/g.24874  ORF Transcript_13755/g.24874 Transcript_13755/m.24874 type:complete len:371 (+) Transcript_13755:116-1228(+)